MTQAVARDPEDLNHRWLDVYPELRDTEVTAHDSVSPEHFQRECDLVFRRTWLYAATASDLPSTGNYVVKDYPALKASVIVIRAADGEVRVFHNACRHRGAKLLDGNSRGSVRRILCNFHGWTYDLQGDLVATPGADNEFDKCKLGLVPVASAVWNGFVFINLDPQPRQSFTEFLGSLASHGINKFPFDREWESWAWRIELKANWKIVKDLFSEAYHVAFVHKDSVDQLYHVAGNRFHKMSLLRFFGDHFLTIPPSNESQTIQCGPVAALTVKLGGASYSRFGKAKSALPGLNAENVKHWAGDCFGLFPNFNIHFFGGLWHYHIFEPVAVDRMVWENRIFFPKATNAGERFAHEFSVGVQQAVALEDLGAAERNQTGLEGGALTNLAVVDEEIILRHTRKGIADFMRQSSAQGSEG